MTDTPQTAKELVTQSWQDTVDFYISEAKASEARACDLNDQLLAEKKETVKARNKARKARTDAKNHGFELAPLPWEKADAILSAAEKLGVTGDEH